MVRFRYALPFLHWDAFHIRHERFIEKSRRKFLGDTMFKTKNVSLFWLLKTICNLKHLKIPLNNFLNLVLLCNENKLEERRVRSKGFWGTIIIFSLEFHVSSQKTLVEMVREILRLLYVLYLICACHLVYYILTLTISLLFLF